MSKSKQKMRRWVIKAGSQMICSGGPLLLRSWMTQVAHLRRNYNIEILWVTSGAIAAAVERANLQTNLSTTLAKSKKHRKLSEKQALSAIGQPLIMDLYNLSLNAAGLLGAQVLLTAGDMHDPTRRKNLLSTLNKLLEWKVVPIINENDAVATEEIQFGDNDSLSSQIAKMVKAEKLILLTDVDGLYSEDPRKNPSAHLIRYRPQITETDVKLAGKGQDTSHGTGGMYSKLLAARTAGKSKIVTHLLRGDIPHNLISLAEGVQLGTQIGGRFDAPK